MNIKKLAPLALLPLLLSGCYKDYTLDYDFTAAYIAYQYDLRTFVIGEEGKFDFTVALAGVVDNTKDRAVEVELRDELLSEDLSQYTTEFGVSSFTALDGLNGKGGFGDLSQKYVTRRGKRPDILDSAALPSTTRLTALAGWSSRRVATPRP